MNNIIIQCKQYDISMNNLVQKIYISFNKKTKNERIEIEILSHEN